MIYLDHCASTPLSLAAKQQILDLMENDLFANPSSANHTEGQKVRAQIEIGRGKLARLFNVNPDQIIYTSGATEANSLVINGFAQKHKDKSFNLLVGQTEHGSVLHTASKVADLFGGNIVLLPVDNQGVLEIEALETKLIELTGQPNLVCAMHTNNEVPARHPIEEISDVCWKYGAAFHCDAVQGVVREAIDFGNLGASSLGFSGHKLGAPKGYGVLMLSKRDDRLQLGNLNPNGQEQGIRPGTLNSLAIIAGNAAVLDFDSKRTEYLKHLQQCDVAFLELAYNLIEGFKTTVSPSQETPGIVNFYVEDIDSTNLIEALPGICMSRGSACNGVNPLSHVHSAIGLPKQISEKAMRISFGSAVTLDQVMDAAVQIGNMVKRLKTGNIFSQPPSNNKKCLTA